MPRRIVACLAALVAAATLGPAAMVAPADAAEPGIDPLQVDIDAITPGVVPAKGPITISGTVTNVDVETWTTINLYSFISAAPMTTQGELAAAVELPEDTAVGERIADPEAAGTIDEIAPGDTRAFSFEVPRKRLGVSEAGVYWFGVQASGQGPDGRDGLTDGRARTFLPLVKPAVDPLPTAVVVPLRRKIAYAADGSVDDLDEWVAALGEGGRLRSLVDLGLSAGSRAVTYLVDPALVDVVEQLAAGNPPRSMAPTDDADAGDGGDDGGGTTPSASTDAEQPGDEPSADPDAVGAVQDADPLTAAAQLVATDWLDRLGRALPGHQILGLPYGDLDIAGASAHNPRSYTVARKRTGTELAPYSLPLDPVVAAPGGYLDEDGLAMLDPADTVLISDAMFVPPATEEGLEEDGLGAPQTVPTVADDGGHRIVVTSRASTTGPGPGEARSALSIRQRVLAEAAVRASGDDPQPLVLMLPNDWNPTESTGFFSGFDVGWLDLMPLGEIATRPATPVSLADLTYPRFQERSELGADNFAAAGDLTRTGEQLQNLLTRNDQVGKTVRDEALTTLSYTARSQPTSARLAAAASARWVRSQLAKVRIKAPPSVTMSGTAGRFSTVITNDLHQPVTVGLTARVDQGIEITHPRKIQVPAADEVPGSATVLLRAKSPEGGTHSVELELTDTDGATIGGSDSLSIRLLQVSAIIWLFIAAALALLFSTIGFRVVRRVRAARRTPQESDEPGEEAQPSATTPVTAGAGGTAEPDA